MDGDIKVAMARTGTGISSSSQRRASTKGPHLHLGRYQHAHALHCGARDFCNRWSEAGPTHHMAAAVGRHIDTILKVAKIFNVPVDIITR